MERRRVELPQRALDLREAEKRYERRFGKKVPGGLLMEFRPAELTAMIDEALANERPVPGWDEMSETDQVPGQ